MSLTGSTSSFMRLVSINFTPAHSRGDLPLVILLADVMLLR